MVQSSLSGTSCKQLKTLTTQLSLPFSGGCINALQALSPGVTSVSSTSCTVDGLNANCINCRKGGVRLTCSQTNHYMTSLYLHRSVELRAVTQELQPIEKRYSIDPLFNRPYKCRRWLRSACVTSNLARRLSALDLHDPEPAKLWLPPGYRICHLSTTRLPHCVSC